MTIRTSTNRFIIRCSETFAMPNLAPRLDEIPGIMYWYFPKRQPIWRATAPANPSLVNSFPKRCMLGLILSYTQPQNTLMGTLTPLTVLQSQIIQSSSKSWSYSNMQSALWLVHLTAILFFEELKHSHCVWSGIATTRRNWLSG